MVGLELQDFLEKPGCLFEVAQFEMGTPEKITRGIDGTIDVFGNLQLRHRSFGSSLA
jgi:hypothetical protein